MTRSKNVRVIECHPHFFDALAVRLKVQNFFIAKRIFNHSQTPGYFLIVGAVEKESNSILTCWSWKWPATSH